MITCLAGGVGAAKFLSGLVQVVPAHEITAVVNTGDDLVLHGLHISPDLDTVTYTLAGAVNPETGWGLSGETWAAMDSLEHYGGESWFRLGDRDLATHLYRTQRLSEGALLDEVTAEVTRRWGLDLRLLPMSNDPVRTMITLESRPEATAGRGGGAPRTGGGRVGVPVRVGEMGFQEWFVGQRHETAVAAVRFAGAEEAEPAPGVVDAIDNARAIVICPSNPIVSIGPLLALAPLASALRSRRESVVAVSPIVGGRALKGPADTLMVNLGHEASVRGMAQLYAPFAGTLVIDEIDADQARAVEAEGLKCVVTKSVMSTSAIAAALATTTLAAVS